ncbi:hypothetical protein JWG39_13245 [Desulforhopalus vacuolatus]|uniref:hypothetical protein n=1 Tax=Desulforhopalus vacuolatus TaxID=40414 RepID=UPI001966B230|nr:hypothetical protein [Desulforhopalus vacuolatus]MBM9520782.1 hypothetical protein [Desulforhopalus vacuolatus]
MANKNKFIILPFDKWLGLILLLNISLKLLWFFQVAIVQGLHGDELSYFNIAASLHNSSNLYDILISLFSHQHRMPGTTILIFFSQSISDSLSFMRFVFMSFETFLFVTSCIVVCRIFGKIITRIFAGFIAVSPMMISFSFNVWGDFIAGWFIFLTALFAYQAIVDNGVKQNYLKYIFIGVLWGGSLYFRPSMIVFGPLLYIGILFLKINSLSFEKIKYSLILISFITLGFAISWGPWMTGASFFRQELTYQPGQNVKQEKWLKWNIWAHSPADSGWGYRRGERYDHDLAIMTMQHGNNKEKALKRMYEKVKQNSTPATLISAISRNISNVMGNENQFLAGTMNTVGIENEPSVWFPKIKRSDTMGGYRLDSNYSPASEKAKLVILFNSYWYYTVLFLSVLWLFSVLLSISSIGTFSIFFMANVVCVMSMSLYHPGHGRYVFSMLPMWVLGASFFGNVLIEKLKCVPRKFFRSGMLIFFYSIFLIFWMFKP